MDSRVRGNEWQREGIVHISNVAFDPHALLAKFATRAKGAGAIASFLGVVRGGHGVEAVDLEHYAAIAENEIAGAVHGARKRWKLIDVLVAHRIGRISAGEAIVLVATAAEHRREAFEACDFLMDYLKTDAPFWKKEIVGGKARWVEPCAEDYRDRERWR